MSAFELDGTWRDTSGTTMTIEGSSGRLVAFPRGPVSGREVFDVGDAYLRAIEGIGDNRFEAEQVLLQTDPALEALVIESVRYAPCTMELTSTDSLKLTRQDGSATYFERLAYEVDEVHGGACEGDIWGVPRYFLCSDAYTEDQCSYEALGLQSILAPIATFEFWPGKTCPELGYAHRFDEPALYQYAASDRETPGPGGHWGGLVNEEDAGVAADGAVADDGGVGPVTDGSVDAVRYLIVGTIWDQAAIDCPEGSATFSDWRAYYWEIVEGDWSDTYSDAQDALDAKMRSEAPDAQAYYVESSWFRYGREATHAVIIEYTQTLLAWDCRPRLITVGYGTTYEEALSQALETKADNDSESMPHTELEHITW